MIMNQTPKFGKYSLREIFLASVNLLSTVMVLLTLFIVIGAFSFLNVEFLILVICWMILLLSLFVRYLSWKIDKHYKASGTEFERTLGERSVGQ